MTFYWKKYFLRDVRRVNFQYFQYFLVICVRFGESILQMLEDIICGPIFYQISIFGIQIGIALYQIETVRYV